MSKPTVFCYKDYTDLKAKYTDLLYKFARLKDEKTNLEIKCRILEADTPTIVRCKDCKHRKYCESVYHDFKDDDFCSRGERNEP